MLKHLILPLYLLACLLDGVSQTLPVGSSIVENYLRRQQLQGDFNSSVSFALRPLHHQLYMDSVTDLPANSFGKALLTSAKGKSYLKLLPVQLHTEFNSHYPYGWNNGAMVRARGVQNLLRAGVYAKWGPLSVQLKPEYVFVQNMEFEGFPDSHSDDLWRRRHATWNGIDTPEQFGSDPLNLLLPGQSSLRLSFKAFSAGASTENIWWGPGRNHSLVMTNNARGFNHLTFNTVRPINTFLGTFETQIIAARLESSVYLAPMPKNRPGNSNWIRPRVDNWRYLNGITLNYQPKWIPGLFLGGSRAIQNYYDSVRLQKKYLLIFDKFLREKESNQFSDGSEDEVASLFVRWLWQDANAEIYLEYGRSDAAWNSRDFLMSPEHSRAYLIGFSKLIPILNEESWIEITLETTHLELSKTGTLRAEPQWYRNARARHGYTHHGEILGAGIGPGSNVQFLSVSWIDGLRQLGIQFERLVNDNDFHYRVFGIEEYNRSWTDVSLGVLGAWSWKHLMLDGKIQFVRSNNYQWEVFGDLEVPESLHGRKENNLYLSARMAYLF